MPAAVIAIPVQLKQTVKQGEPLMVLEAMKMEHTISAPFAGTVTAIYFAIGNVVQEGSKLVELEPEAA
jgi:3-methylcrotonyl-CoA carboxylase alpha subunit